MACSWDVDENIQKAEALVRKAADAGAQVILLQELFQTPYFCLEEKYEYLSLARSITNDRAVQHFQTIARSLGVVLPISYFERAGQAAYNSLAILDADGSLLWNYRKSHIPQNPGYEEKFYFSPGDTGFRAIDTRYARIGCGICWDQWFPETARSLALQGAEVLLFPTAIGSEPENPEIEFDAALAARDAGTCGSQYHAVDRLKPGGAGSFGQPRGDVLRRPPLLPIIPAPRWPRRTGKTRPS